MNKDTIEGEWKQLVGEIQKRWGELTHDSITQINGSREKLSGAIQKQYGIARDVAENQMNEWEKTYKKLTKSD